MSKKGIKIRQLAEEMDLELLAGEKGLDKEVRVEMISRPGIEMAGIFDYIDAERLILIGVKESRFLDSFSDEIKKERLHKLLSYKPPAIIFPQNKEVELVIDLFKEIGEEYGVPILRSELNTTPLNSQLYFYLHKQLAERIGVHGVFVDIYGMGTLIIGRSGIGKSETALELIKRGHILISDDLVEIYQSTVGNLIGTAPSILRRYLEIRGIGIVDVISMFGTGAYRESKRVSLVVELERWRDDKEYDRIGLSNETVVYFNTEIPKITIPVLPGRNVATLVESAAMNQKLKSLGHNAALNFTKAVSKHSREGHENNEKWF